MKKRIIVTTIILSLFIASIVFGIMQNNTYNNEGIHKADGFMDLSEWNFEEKGTVKLNNRWEIYYNKFIYPEEFAGNLQGEVNYVTLPTNKATFKNEKPFKSNYFYATLRTKIKVSDPSKILGLKTTLILSSYKIFVDGKEIGEVGKVGNSKNNSSPRYGNLESFFKPVDDQVEIIIHTSDFNLGDCMIGVPELGTIEQITRKSKLALGKELFVFGILIIISIYHFGLYIKRRKDKAIIYFAMFCFFVALRTIIVGERFILDIIPMSHNIYSRLGYLTAYCSIYVLTGYLYYTLEGLFPKLFLNIAKYISIITGIATITLSYRYYDMLLYPFSGLLFVYIVYTIYKLVKGLIKKHEYADHVLFGFMLIGIAFINDLIYQFILINKGSMIPIGVAAFTISQAFTLASKFSQAFSTAEILTEENEKILSDLKNANTSLELRVIERTKELSQTLEELEIMSKTDYLTKLPNRRHMFEIIASKISKEDEFHVVIGDIDNFKDINDTYGHNVGDELLVHIANILRENIKDLGVVCRWGGEEFLFILNDNKKENVTELIEKIRTEIENTPFINSNNTQINVTMTFGISRYMRGMNIDHCISISDKALYEGKEKGRNKCIYCGS